MDKKHRHELQHDGLKDALLEARDYVTTHRGQTTRTAAVAVAVALVVGAVWGGVALRNRRLATRFSTAIGLFDAPLASEGTVPPGQRAFRDAAERTAAAKDELRKLARDAPSSEPGRASTLVLVALDGPAAATGANLDAVKAFARSERGTIAGGIAFASLLDAQASSGRVKEAIDLAKKALDGGDASVTKDVLLLALGRLSEKAGQNAEAKSYYLRVLTDYPDSPVRSEAQQRSQGL
jgi:tetratricopeptide (TPR) repeat protein